MTVEAILLGSAQDAGIPQAGCYCENCQAVRERRAPRGYATSLALVDHAEGGSWIIDASPDFREQFALLREGAARDSVLAAGVRLGATGDRFPLGEARA